MSTKAKLGSDVRCQMLDQEHVRTLTDLIRGLQARGLDVPNYVGADYAARPVQPSIRTRRWPRSMPFAPRTVSIRSCSMRASPGRRPCNRRSRRGAAEPPITGRTGRSPRTAWLSAEDRRGECRLRPEILQRRHALWEGSSGHRRNLLLPAISAAGVAIAQAENGRAYWTLVLGAE